jgi:protein arginine N-methyltransferase 1
MYSVADFGRMIDDEARMGAFRKALAATIDANTVVLDLGAGTGIMALLACRYGAKRVYAVEPSDALQVARETATMNDLSGRIVCIQQRSAAVTLPERVDVIVEDMRGALPWCSTHIPDLIDARERFLKPGGQIIPREDTVFCAVVSAEEQYRDRLLPWQSTPENLDLSPAARYVENAPSGVRFKAKQLLSAPLPWATIDYRSVASTKARGEFALQTKRKGSAHGLLLWFESELLPDAKISNAPGRSKNVYGQLFLPWPHPIELKKDARVEVGLRADLVGEDYVWTWETHCGEHQFRQSSFAAAPLTAESLARRAAHHRPSLGPEGKVARFVLERMAGAMTLAEIGTELARAFPQRFRTEREAFDYAAKLSGDYSA